MPITIVFGLRQPSDDPEIVCQNRPGNIPFAIVKTLTPKRPAQKGVLEVSDSALALAASVLQFAKTCLFHALTQSLRTPGANRIIHSMVPDIAIVRTVKASVTNDCIR